MDSGERDIAREEITAPRNTFHDDGVIDHTKLDEDERLTKTFESVRSDMATAWNSNMVWVDKELVFSRLNTLMTVAKDATDRVIEMTSRAKGSAANKLKSIKN